jgi:hypothetical protein
MGIGLAGCGSDYLATVSGDVGMISTDLGISQACAAEVDAATDPNCTKDNATTRQAERALVTYANSAQVPTESEAGGASLANDATGLVDTPMTGLTGLINQSGLVQDMQTVVHDMDLTEGGG